MAEMGLTPTGDSSASQSPSMTNDASSVPHSVEERDAKAMTARSDQKWVDRSYPAKGGVQRRSIDIVYDTPQESVSLDQKLPFVASETENMDWVAFATMYVRGQWDPTTIPAMPGISSRYEGEHTRYELGKLVYYPGSLTKQHTGYSSDNAVAERLGRQMESHFAKQGYLPTYWPYESTSRLRIQWYAEQMKKYQAAGFRQVCQVASQLFNAPYVSVKLIGPQSDSVSQGQPVDGPAPLLDIGLYPLAVVQEWTYSSDDLFQDEIGWSQSLGQHALYLRHGQALVVPDVEADWRFARSPYRQRYGCFVSVPLVLSSGEVVGALVIADNKPRAALNEGQVSALVSLGDALSGLLENALFRAQFARRDQLKQCTEYFMQHFINVETDERIAEGSGELPVPRPPSPISSEFINVSEKKAPMSMPSDNSLSADGSNGSADELYLHIYNYAARSIHYSTDVSGVVIFDITHFVFVQQPQGQDGKMRDVVLHSQLMGEKEDGLDATSRGRGAILPVMGTCETLASPATRGEPLDLESIKALCVFLSTSQSGRQYRRMLPGVFQRLFPEGALHPLIVPIFGLERQPFALMCAYGTASEYSFVLDQMCDVAIQHIRAIGYLMMNVVLKKMLVLADRANSSFISNMSHELRTPLHGILASTELLRDTSLTPLQTTYMRTIESCGHGLLELVNHVLDYAKLRGRTPSSGRAGHQIEQTACDLVQLIQEVCDSSWIGYVGYFQRVIMAGSSRSDHLPGQMPLSGAVELVIDSHRRSNWVWCDSGGLRRIIMNLVGNALKFTKRGYVHVSLRSEPVSSGSQHIVLRVRDTGRGMSRAFIDQHIFQPFSQENPHGPGTGLGLSIVRKIAESLPHGQVDVKSTAGKGTDMIVSFEANTSTGHADDTTPRLNMHQLCTAHLIGFPATHRGANLLAQTLSRYLVEWWGFLVELHDADWDAAAWVAEQQQVDTQGGDKHLHVLLLNNEARPLAHLIEAVQDIKVPMPPALLLLDLCNDPELVAMCDNYAAAGGMTRLLQKPVGPARLEAVLSMYLKCPDTVNHPGMVSARLSESRVAADVNDARLGGFRARTRLMDEVADAAPLGSESSFAYPSLMNNTGRSSAAPLEAVMQGLKGMATSAPTRLGEPTGVVTVAEAVPSSAIDAAPSPADALPNEALAPLTPSSRQSDSSWPVVETMSGTGMRPSHEAPVPTVPNMADERTGSPAYKKLHEVGADNALSGSCVLFVDDNAVNRQVLRAYLKKLRIAFVEACDGREGVDAFAAHPPGFFHLILMDFSMPKLDGIGAASEIRRIERRREHVAQKEGLRIPRRSVIFMLSGVSSPMHQRQGLSAGADGYLEKPLSFKTFCSLLASYDVR